MVDFLTFIAVLALATLTATLAACAWTTALGATPERTTTFARTTAARFTTPILMG
jgi:hypothetical protein